MREIKFRGKDAKDKWVYGYYSRSQTGMHLIDAYTQSVGCKPTFVKPETIGQFTALKDKNGTEIYEGDIVKHNDWNYNFEVVFSIQRARFVCKMATGLSHFIDNSNIAVKSNIHDNPELLEA